jgi:nucleoside-diphosphate-sugar epimerase
MRTVLVTGGAGLIGSHLVDRLLEDGVAVRVLDNLSTGSLENLQVAAGQHLRNGATNGSRLEVIVGDIRDRELLRKALRNVKYVFHLAALPGRGASAMDPSDVHSVNVDGTLNVLQGALTEGVWRVVLASCGSVYGTPDTASVSEDSAARPASLFSASKVAAESYCRAFHVRHQLDTVVLRYFSVYGPRQKTGADALIRNLIDALQQRRPFVEEDDRNVEDFIYVDDAVAATLAAGRAPRAGGRVINVGSGQMFSIGDVLNILAELMRTSAIRGFARNPESQPRRMVADMTQAAEVLGFTPRVSLMAGLVRVIRCLDEPEQPEQPALARVGGDD